MSVLPKMNVTWMPLVLTPKDLTTVLVKMDLRATVKTAQVTTKSSHKKDLEKGNFFCHDFPNSHGASKRKPCIFIIICRFHSFSRTLTNALLKTTVIWMPLVTTPKDLTTALVKMDLKAMGEINARVRFIFKA